MALEELFQFTLNMRKRQSILERILRASLTVVRKQRPKPKFLGSTGVKKAKVIKIEVEASPPF
jgi:hypothetical protein